MAKSAILRRSGGSASKTSEGDHSFNPGRFLGGLTETHYPKGLSPSASVVRKHSELVDWLIKKHSDDAATMDLADRLDNCERENRCLSGACPFALTLPRRSPPRSAAQVSRVPPDRTKIVCVSVVPSDGQIPAGQLNAAQHTRNVRRWKEALGRCWRDLVPRRYGLELQRAQERTLPRVLARAFLRVHGYRRSQEAQQSLKEQFPPNDAIPRPVQVKSWDGDKTAIDYMLKPTFRRRIGTDEGQRHDEETGGERECRATDKQPLRAEQKHELLLFLDQIGIQSRFLMRWLQFVHLAGTGWTVADRAPQGRMHGNGQGG